MEDQVIQARRKKKSQMMGVGCLIQALGIAVFLLGLAMFQIAGAVIGGIICLVLLVYGSEKSIIWSCEHCGNRIDGKQVKICPTCKAQLT